MNAKNESSDQKNDEEIEKRAAPPGQIVYEAIRLEAEHELSRDNGALAWSGLAAGLSMGFSMLAQAMLHHYLPDAQWTPLVTSFGYTVGFLIVILGRQQLFTENTLTPVLELFRNRSGSVAWRVAQLWGIVLVTNLIGGFLLAWVVAHTELVSEDVRAACAEIASHTAEVGFGTALLRGIAAGWLIALMIWLLPYAESARIWVIIIISYLVGIGDFTHVIAGGIESFYLVAIGEVSIGRSLGGYILPTLIGNIIGGVSLVAAFAYAQFVAAGRHRDHEDAG